MLIFENIEVGSFMDIDRIELEPSYNVGSIRVVVHTTDGGNQMSIMPAKKVAKEAVRINNIYFKFLQTLG